MQPNKKRFRHKYNSGNMRASICWKCKLLMNHCCFLHQAQFCCSQLDSKWSKFDAYKVNRSWRACKGGVGIEFDVFMILFYDENNDKDVSVPIVQCPFEPQLCAKSGTSDASTDQGTNALWWSTDLGITRRKQSCRTFERQVEDQTQEEMVTGWTLCNCCWYCVKRNSLI